VTSIPLLVLAGAAVGLLYGLFGVGAAFATPMLAVLGVPPLAAVASPLPALLPGSASGGWAYARTGLVDATLARRTLAGAVPACIVGSLTSRWIGGPWLLVFSGFVLLLVGGRVLVTQTGRSEDAPPATRAGWTHRRSAIVAIGVGIGFVAGLLANGGGFLLVPTFLLAVGLTLPEATATSLVVVTVLTIPAVVTHALIGDIDWSVAAPFAAGLVPATALAALVANRVDVVQLRAAFGVLLFAVGGWFLWRELRLLGLA
jgi:uncharacterized membrane protein YfcA